MFVVKCYSFNQFIGYLSRYNKSCILCVTRNLQKALQFDDMDFFAEQVIPCLPHKHFTYIIDEIDICNFTGVYYDV